MSIELVNSKVSALVGPALNWAVVKSLGLDLHHNAILGGVVMDGWHVSGLRGDPNRWVSLERCDYASDWALSGPMIEREKINVTSHGDDWIAGYPKPVEFEGFRKYVFCGGDTPLNAALRCFVESRLGAEVQVPADLLEQEQNSTTSVTRTGSRSPGLEENILDKKTVKVSELSGSTLDWAVVESMGWEKTIGKTDEGRKSAVLVDVKGVWRKFNATELANYVEGDTEVSLRRLVTERLGNEVQIPSVLVDEQPTHKPSGMGL